MESEKQSVPTKKAVAAYRRALPARQHEHATAEVDDERGHRHTAHDAEIMALPQTKNAALASSPSKPAKNLPLTMSMTSAGTSPATMMPVVSLEATGDKIARYGPADNEGNAA